jgi:hypothetical protein
LALLAGLRRIDAMEANLPAGNDQGVAVDRPRGTHDVGGDVGGRGLGSHGQKEQAYKKSAHA